MSKSISSLEFCGAIFCRIEAFDWRYNLWMIPPKYIKQTVDALGGIPILGRHVSNLDDLTLVVHSGIPETALSTLISRISAAHMKDSPTYLIDLFERNPKTDGPVAVLTTDAGHSLIRIACLFVSLCERVDSEAQVANFLMTKHPELNNTMPAVAAMTEPGLQAVEEIVARGEHGLPA